MTTKMNNETHKVIIASYHKEVLYAVPIEWKVKYISILKGNVSYNGNDVDVPSCELDFYTTLPTTIEEDDEDFELEEYFDCE